MNNYELLNTFCKKYYGRDIKVSEYKQFINYVQQGKIINGVKPIFNHINCFAYLLGITSKEADDLMFEKLGEGK